MATTLKKTSATVQKYQELPVWKVSVDLAVIIYKMTATFHEQHLHGISSDLKRGVLDICTGIAFACQKSNAAERSADLMKVIEQTVHLECLLFVASRLGLLSPDVLQHYTGVLTEIRNMLRKLTRTTQRSKKSN
jgi:four helix bundle protein